MNTLKVFLFTADEVKTLENLADSIYNIVVVLNYYCSNKREIEEFYNITPILANLHQLADKLNSIFINLNSSKI